MKELESLLERVKKLNPNVQEHGGLPAPEIEKAFAKIGLKAPEKLITLFEWRNGIDELNAFTCMFNLSAAIDCYKKYKELSKELKDFKHAFNWKSEWFPIIDINGDYQVCLDTKTGGLALVDMECDMASPICDSYRIYLQALNEGFEKRVFRWNEEHGLIEGNDEDWKAILSRHGLPEISER